MPKCFAIMSGVGCRTPAMSSGATREGSSPPTMTAKMWCYPVSIIRETFEYFRTARVFQLPQRLGLDLADSLA